jgi:CheY-like chemotaxis protein
MVAVRILVVDDDEDCRQMFRDLLTIIGYEADTVESFRDAKDSLRRFKYDLVLLDIALDQSTTHLAFQMICRFLQQEYPELPIVATSGLQIHPRFMWKLCNLGVANFVFKGDILLDDFQQCLQEALTKDELSYPLAFRDAYALLIGVGDYTHPRFASLPATIHDAWAIETVLTDPDRCGYPGDNVQVITGPEATAANIRTVLKTLVKSTNLESTVFVYFSGHGGRAQENDAWCVYLCPNGADPDDLPSTAISGNEFSDLIAAIPARKLLVMLDACHAAGSADLKKVDGTLLWKASLPNDYYETLSQGSGRVVIASSKEDQFSYIRQQDDLSLFTWHLLEGLKGAAAVREDGVIRVLDLFHYVSQQVKSEQPNQEPILNAKDMDDNFPIALTPIRTL